MTQEERQLLLIDLCARLPYGVKFASFSEDMIYHSEPVILRQIYWNEDYNANGIEGDGDMSTIIEFVKPYLRPMSSMTEEEKIEYSVFFNYDGVEYPDEYIDWLNKKMFDYRGLIEKGLALEAPEGMYKNE